MDKRHFEVFSELAGKELMESVLPAGVGAGVFVGQGAGVLEIKCLSLDNCSAWTSITHTLSLHLQEKGSQKAYFLLMGSVAIHCTTAPHERVPLH